MQQSDRDLEEKWLDLLRRGEALGLENLFRRYYVDLCRASVRIVKREEAAEDIVQEFFAGLWEKRASLPQIVAIGPYFRRGIRNRSLNYLRDHHLLISDDGELPDLGTSAEETSAPLELQELRERVDRAVDALPERCRLVYVLRQFEGMSYREISGQLNISEKTVENQMNRAYKYLRRYLSAALLFLTYCPP